MAAQIVCRAHALFPGSLELGNTKALSRSACDHESGFIRANDLSRRELGFLIRIFSVKYLDGSSREIHRCNGPGLHTKDPFGNGAGTLIPIDRRHTLVEHFHIAGLCFILRVSRSFAGFDIPHLTKKYAAYRLPNPLEGKHFLDLLKKLRQFDALFPLSSHRLADYMSLFPENEVQAASSDAEKELLLTSLLPLEGFLAGNFTLTSARTEGDVALFELLPKDPLPVSLRAEDGPFVLTLEGDRACLSAELFEGRLRRYYPDYRNYEYLTREGYAVHKSVSSGVGKDRKEKAVRENCFSFFRCTESFLSDGEAVRRYVVSVFAYMRSGG